MTKLNKKIIFVLCTFDLGGAEKQAILLGRHLKEKGFNVEFWAFAKEGPASELISSYGMKWRIYPVKLTKGAKSLFSYLKFAFALRKSNPTILLPYTYWPNVICGTIWKFTGAKACIWNQRDEGGGFGLSKFEGLAYKNSSLVISNSTEGKIFLQNRFSNSKKEIKIIFNGIEVPSLKKSREEIRKELGVGNDQLVALMLANITDRKDHKTLINAWKNVTISNKDLPPPLLILAGRQDNATNSVRKLINDLKLNDFIKLIGFVEDTSSLINAADVCTFSSNLEGTPNGILECMATGLPVVATDIMGIRDCLGEDYEYLIEPNNSKLFSEKIVEILKNKDLRKNLGEMNKKRIELNFRLEKMFGSYEELLNGIPS